MRGEGAETRGRDVARESEKNGKEVYNHKQQSLRLH